MKGPLSPGLSPTLQLSEPVAQVGDYAMFIYGFFYMVLVISSHGFVLLSMTLTLIRSQKRLEIRRPFKFKLMFTGLILVLLMLHMAAIHAWAVFLWLTDGYRSFMSAFYDAGLAYTELGAFGENRPQGWQRILPFMIAFSGLFSVGLSGSMLFTLLMSAARPPTPPEEPAPTSAVPAPRALPGPSEMATTDAPEARS